MCGINQAVAVKLKLLPFLIFRALSLGETAPVQANNPPDLSRLDRKNPPSIHTPHLAADCTIKALIVDNHPLNKEALASTLKYVGVTVDIAGTGAEFIEKVHTVMPDIVFMDMRMMALGGRESLLAVHNEFGRDCFKIVALTASGLDYQREEYIKAGCHYIISKPVRVEAIRECLASLAGARFAPQK